MRVLIPAAGFGQRFKDKGYTDPKPLVNVRGKPMLQHVLDLVKSVDPNPIVICQAKDYSRVYPFYSQGVHFQPVYEPQVEGAAMTVLCAMGVVPDDEPVMVVNCDNLLTQEVFDGFAEYAQDKARKGYGSLVAMAVEAGPWSYVRRCWFQPKQADYIAEKRQISNLATCGFYSFAEWKHLRNAICDMVHKRNKTKGEYYLAPVYNYLEDKAWIYEIPYTEFTSLGTPEDVEAYNARS